ncbi:MAG: hypothetical protein ACLGI5_13045 [Thermoleophilia bacterium]
MNHRSRRGLAVVAAVSTLAGGSLSIIGTPANAADGAPSGSVQGRGLLDGLLSGLLGQIAGATVATIEGIISGLTPTQVGDLIENAAPADLPNLLAAAQNNGQLAPALGTLTATENGDVLAPTSGSSLTLLLGGLGLSQLTDALGTLTAGETAGLLTAADATQRAGLLAVLTSGQLSDALGTLEPATLATIVGGLTPAQISGLLGAGGGASVIDGLLGTAAGLGATPATPQVDGLLGQLTALLGGGLPGAADQADLASLLGLVDPLLAQPGVDTTLLASLLATAEGLLGGAPEPVRTPLQTIVTTISSVLSPATGGGDTTGGGGTAGGGATGGGATTGGGTTTTTGGTAATGGTAPGGAGATIARPAAQPAARPGPFRATIGAIKLSKRRTSMRFTLSCPRSAPKGCLVQLSAKIAGRKAIRTTIVALASGRSTPVTVTLSKSTTRRLKARGGSLKVTAKTALSTLGASSRTLKVRRLKTKKRRTARR